MGCCDLECFDGLHHPDVHRNQCCELCCHCGVYDDDFDADELGLDPEERFDA